MEVCRRCSTVQAELRLGPGSAPSCSPQVPLTAFCLCLFEPEIFLVSPCDLSSGGTLRVIEPGVGNLSRGYKGSGFVVWLGWTAEEGWSPLLRSLHKPSLGVRWGSEVFS